MLVLFVDDDREDYEIFCDALSEVHPKAKCIYASGGVMALDTLKELIILPDYIFLDVNMPMMDGKEVLTRLKSHTRFQSVPVIVYSTTTNEREKIVFKDLGAQHFLAKPPDFNGLLGALRNLIK